MKKVAHSNGRFIREGDWLTLDGNEGVVYEGEVKLSTPDLPAAFSTLMGWADGIRKLGVRTNADTPYDARKGREMGASGIGLCRTEHMFFKDFEQPEKSIERQQAIQEMIVAESPEARRKALDKLLPFQRRDFIGIFKAMDGFPVTIRLIDPPLHEFVPHDREKQEELARKIGVAPEIVARRVEQLRELNPMLGHRGCRLAITFPEILEMQVRAIIEAAVVCKKEGVKVFPEIMIPLVMDRKELQILTDNTHRVAMEIIKNSGVKLEYLVGTMIELPRAALLANEIAEVAEFFSFGTNDLTQMTMGLDPEMMPDDSCLTMWGKQKRGYFLRIHFRPWIRMELVCCHSVGRVERGRSTRPNLKIGICGEHGGDAASVKFCHQVGMDYGQEARRRFAYRLRG